MKTPREWVEWLYKHVDDVFDPENDTATWTEDVIARAVGEAIEECARVAETSREPQHPEHIDGCCGTAIAAAIRQLGAKERT